MERKKHTPVENFVIFLALLLLYVQTSARHYVRADRFDGAALYADVVHYVKLGIHRTGTAGDNKTSEWIKGILDKNGFKTEYVTFPVKQFFPEKAQLSIGGNALELFPVWPVADPNVQLTGILFDARKGTEGTRDKIVWISQASKERSFSFLDQDNATVIKRFIESGARAIILIADNAAGEIAAINTSPGDSWAVPVVQLAPKHLQYLKDGAQQSLWRAGGSPAKGLFQIHGAGRHRFVRPVSYPTGRRDDHFAAATRRNG